MAYSSWEEELGQNLAYQPQHNTQSTLNSIVTVEHQRIVKVWLAAWQKAYKYLYATVLDMAYVSGDAFSHDLLFLADC